MTDYTDRGTEALLARRAIAKKATPGPWWAETAPFFVPLAYAVRCKTGRLAGLNSHTDGSHIAANSPDVVIADIDEILRLRAEVKRLENEADWLAEKLVESRPRLCQPPYVGAEEGERYIAYGTKGEARESWREAARKAVEGA